MVAGMYDLYTGPSGRKYYLERFIPTFPPHLRVPQDLVKLPRASCVNNREQSSVTYRGIVSSTHRGRIACYRFYLEFAAFQFHQESPVYPGWSSGGA